jgi:hypothetical protein
MVPKNPPAFTPSQKAVQKTSRRKDLPSFYVAEKNADVLRAHLTYREGYVFENDNLNNNKNFSHFIAVPLDILPQYEGNDVDPSSYMWELTKMTSDQLRKLVSKLGRPGQAGKTKSELLECLYMISSEEEGVSELQNLDNQLQIMFPPPTKVVFRLITTIFGESFRAEFSRLNDTKKRAAFEAHFVDTWLIVRMNLFLLFHHICCQTLHQYRCQYSCFGSVISTKRSNNNFEGENEISKTNRRQKKKKKSIT